MSSKTYLEDLRDKINQVNELTDQKCVINLKHKVEYLNLSNPKDVEIIKLAEIKL